MFEWSPVSERIKLMREKYRDSVPQLCPERLELITEFYKNNEAEMGILKRARALEYILKNCTILIEDDELLVGNISSYYRGANILPEYGINWLFDELRSGEFFERGNQEEGYYVSEEDQKRIMACEDFWKQNNMGARMSRIAPDGFWDILGTDVMQYDNNEMCNLPTGHYNTNYDKVIRKGLGAIRDEAKEKMAAMEGRIFGADAEKYVFYKAVTIVTQAAIDFSRRYAAKCRELIDGASEERKAELEEMADSLEWILENPCRNFRDSLQAILLFQFALSYDGQMHGLTIGRLDQYLGDFYDKDVETGVLTPEQGQELMDCFMLKISDTCKVWSRIVAATSGGYTSGQHMTLGGQTKDGHDATNAVSYMMLQSMGRLQIHEPPLSLRVHKNTPPELWEAAIRTTMIVGGIPELENDEVIIPALLRKGLSLEDARNYCIIGCVEPSGTGCEFPACGGSGRESYWNMAQAMLIAMNNGINPLTGAQSKVHTGYLYEMKSFEEVKEAYVKQVNYFVDWNVSMTNFYELCSRDFVPCALASSVMDGCMENGKDVKAGGAKYNSTGMSGIGCANVADMLSAIKYMIFDKKICTAREFYDAVQADWEGYEHLRQIVINEVPHYGNDDPYVDELARWSMNVFSNRVNEATGPRGGFRPGLYPVSAHIGLGKLTGATYDGRKAHTPLADGVSPGQGLDKKGPFASLNSVAKLDHMNNGNGTLLNMKFHPKSVEGEDGVIKLENLVQTFFDKGGMHVQYNVIGTDTLRDAQIHPENHKNLVIRIAGFSAYFVDLYKELQDDLIARTEISM